ncbi:MULTISPECIES: response regulator transcription factor [Nostoc]|uniref:Helix-turn-helix transcriptional regulator n=2 Tax=Nostoc TaxID=1177 RepID=A0ABR8IHM6_9NOSO|nr:MULTISPECIES: helix-turn-helix transcriptional regulator [Nostoc]MBD2564682.1 helix-turn-helix transcriptional regulator [Nostoc linckia FACHB-391]MBD2650404.1 helix-turn-helix transcriptional regulator [Nostoc foliaceum FACHB-393]
MQGHVDQTSSIFAGKLVSDSCIISKFFIKNSGFLIIAVESPTENSQQFTSEVMIDTISFCSVVGHFEADGNHYAIVKTQNTPEVIDPSLISILTGRELQIAALVGLGSSNKKVANQLQISESTVSAHLRRIFIKLKVNSRSAMVYHCSSLINRLHQLRTMQEQTSASSQSGNVAQSAMNDQTLDPDIAEIDRLLCSALSTSDITS